MLSKISAVEMGFEYGASIGADVPEFVDFLIDLAPDLPTLE